MEFPQNKRLIDFIRESGLSKSQFAKSIAINPSIMSHISSSRNKIGTDILIKIAETYPGLNLNWLLTGEGNMLNSNNSRDLKNNLQRMSDELAEVKSRTQVIERQLSKIIEQL